MGKEEIVRKVNFCTMLGHVPVVGVTNRNVYFSVRYHASCIWINHVEEDENLTVSCCIKPAAAAMSP